ncbi:hypothetical protein ScPMuIL_004693 [Solemya velum]
MAAVVDVADVDNPQSSTSERLSENPDTNDYWECHQGGKEAIEKACSELYPDQPNPLITSACVKFWLGGPNPLDYISMYSNPGDSDRGVPPHWHYISFGFSDLHGDGRVHAFTGPGQMSGFGFELTFRLAKEDDDSIPPTWPTALMNRLANYVFQTGNTLQVGDHIPWHKSLDSSDESTSRIHHMLITEDIDLPQLETPYGNVEFRQIVGVMDDEVKIAQKWKGAGVLELMMSVREIGPYFITDMSRPKSIFEMDSNLLQLVANGIQQDGSNLGHVTAVCTWADLTDGTAKEPVACVSSKGAPGAEDAGVGEEEMLDEPDACEAVQLKFDVEAAELLPMVVGARLKKGRFFVFHNAENYAIHLVPPGIMDDTVVVNEGEPLKAKGTFLQIYCSENLTDRMAQEFELLQELKEEDQHYPVEFRFSEPTILVTVTPRGVLECEG